MGGFIEHVQSWEGDSRSSVVVATTTINSEGEWRIQTHNKRCGIIGHYMGGKAARGGCQVGGPAGGKHPLGAVIVTKCTYKLATCSIPCLLCRCGGTERLNKMVAACKPMRRAGGGRLGHSERSLEPTTFYIQQPKQAQRVRGHASVVRAAARWSQGG